MGANSRLGAYSNKYVFKKKKNQTRHPKKNWSWSLTRVAVYKRFQLKRFDLENFCVFERWLIMEDGRLRDVVARGSATVT